MSLRTLLPPFSRDRAPVSNARGSQPVQGVKPLYEIRESDDAFTARVYVPGVAKSGLEITAEQEVVTLVGRREWKAPEGWNALYRESVSADFVLALRHDHSIDLERIGAELKDGVLTVTLPKAEAVKPRKIQIA